MPNNGFLPFAQGAGANVPTDAAWATYAALAQGFQAGVAPSAGVNKALRQSTVLSSALGQFIADYAQQDTSDGQSIATLEANFRAALAAGLDGARMGVDTSNVANAIVFSLTPLPPTLAGLKVVWFKPAVTNTGATSIQIVKSDGSTPAFASVPVKRRDGADVQAGDLVAGSWYASAWDGTAARLTNLAKSEISGLGGGSFLGLRIITASGTYTPTPGATKVKVFATGGGGAGGSSNGQADYNGSGGEGGTTAIKVLSLAGISTIPVTIGAGGAPSAANASSLSVAGAGGQTSFGTYAIAPGGAGGVNSTNGNGGTQSAPGGTGDILLPGNPGAPQLYNTGTGGQGGSSYWGGPGAATNNTNVGVVGASAIGWGSGGAGGDSGTYNAVSGGAGKQGIVVIEEYA